MLSFPSTVFVRVQLSSLQITTGLISVSYTIYILHLSVAALIPIYEGRSCQTGTVNFTGIKRDASVTVLHAVVSGKCVLLLIGGAHVTGQSRDR
jgi:hypothetical protein